MQRNAKLPPVLDVLYTHNPFYLLSTCFVLYAIKRAFQPGVAEYIDPWALMATLTGFTLLAAVTAWVVVRFGKVWEDARSIVLVLVLMFLAISVSFDEILNILSTEAVGLLAFGFGFSVVVTEAILRSLRIRFPAAYRVPFYLMLALFFAYPVFVSPEVSELTKSEVRWRIAWFPAAAGAVALLLLFAVRRGADHVSDNGTPWRWPWFPWTVFGFLGFAVCARSYSLSISFDESIGALTDMNSAFGGYFLVPFLLASLVLLLEIGIVEGVPRLRRGAIAVAAFLPLLAVPLRTGDPTHSAFLAEFVATLGSPVYLTLLAVVGFYLYAWVRGVVWAEFGATAMLLLLAVVGPQTLDVRSLSEPQAWPFLVLAALQLAAAIRRRSAPRALLAAVCGIAALTLLTWQPDWLLWRRLLPAHLLLAATVAIGWAYRDTLARALAAAAALLLPPVCLFTVWTLQEAGVPPAVTAAYLAGMTAIAAVHWYFSRDRWYLAAAAVNVVFTVGGASWIAFRQATRRLGADVSQPLLFGIAFFAIAVLISAHKAGAFGGLLTRRGDPDGSSP